MRSSIAVFSLILVFGASQLASAHTVTLESGFTLRAGPGTNYREFSTTTRDRSITVSRYSSDKKWARVIFSNGKVAWVSARGLTGDHTKDEAQEERTVDSPPERPPAETSASTDVIGEKYRAMRYDSVAASGSCLLNQIKTSQQAETLLSYYNIKTPGATATEKIAVANGVFQASALYGGKFEALTNVTIRFSSRSGFSRYLSGDRLIDLNRCNKHGRNCGAGSNVNVARLMHEFGHAFGHSRMVGNRSMYDHFAGLRGCYPTRYSDDNLVENTGEIFSAFLTRPTLLTRGSRACKKAYEFLSTRVFKQNGSLASCDALPKQRLLAQIQGIDSKNNITTASIENAFRPRSSSDGVTQIASLPEQPGSSEAVREPASL